MTRLRNVPLDDVFPGDVVTVFTTSPICIAFGRAGQIVRTLGRTWLEVCCESAEPPLLIETHTIARIERHRKNRKARA